MSDTENTQRLLAQIRQGDHEAWNRLFELVYEDLRKVAHLHLRGRDTGTLGTTAMVNETYLRLSGGGASWTRGPGTAARHEHAAVAYEHATAIADEVFGTDHASGAQIRQKLAGADPLESSSVGSASAGRHD